MPQATDEASLQTDYEQPLSNLELLKQKWDVKQLWFPTVEKDMLWVLGNYLFGVYLWGSVPTHYQLLLAWEMRNKGILEILTQFSGGSVLEPDDTTQSLRDLLQEKQKEGIFFVWPWHEPTIFQVGIRQ